jgi:hypothetical protein
MQNCNEHFFRTNQRSARKEKDITGTIIYIWGLSEILNFQLEDDILVRYREPNSLEKLVPKKCTSEHGSLRNHLVFLYQSPKMAFYVRGKAVRSYLIIKELSEKLTYDIKYRTEEKIKADGTLVKSKTRGNGIIFGQNTKFGQSGINFYYKGRLIKSFVKIGELKKKGDSLPIIGIVDADKLRVNHSKTDFAEDKESSKLEAQIKDKLKRYIKESGLNTHNDTTGELKITNKRKSMNSISSSFLAVSKNSENKSGKRMHDDGDEMLTNVQCVRCLKWRAISEEQGKFYDENEFECRLSEGLSCERAEDSTNYDNVRSYIEKNAHKQPTTPNPPKQKKQRRSESASKNSKNTGNSVNQECN